MSKIRYVKAPPGYTLKRPPSKMIIWRQILSLILLTVGTTALTTVIYPMLYYQSRLAPRLVTSTENVGAVSISDNPSLINPSVVLASEPQFVREMINTTLDYTDSNTWFDDARVSSKPIEEISYQFSIPRLGINNATVVTSHSDLKKSLIHYPGTALPGNLGNSVIFGHSVLPQFFSPTNYLSIFSTLHTLEIGDEIEINHDNVYYRYQIADMYEVTPDNLAPLAQTFDRHYLTVITCTPPGTYLRRLVIRAELIN